MKVNDLVSIKESIKLNNGKTITSGSVGIIIDIAYNSKTTLYKVHLPGAIDNIKFKGYYFSKQHIEVLGGSK